MADEGPTEPTLEDKDEEEQEYEAEEESSSSSSSEEESEYDSDDSNEGGGDYYGFEEEAEDDDSPQSNIRRFMEVLESKSIKREQEEEEREITYQEDLFDFPKDPENWREEDLKELWVDAPVDMTKPGWDPAWADEEDWEVVKEEIKAGRDPAIAPFYLPYRKCYPVIPDNHYDISNPKSVIEELDRIEEFLKWVSYIFPDGSSYEGTVWDDLAHGKGVYVAEQGLVRYEGEWLQNNMEGHGVVEVEIPGIEPVPGSKLEARMRAEGKIISRDYMSPEDREWLEMDIEDSIRLARGNYEIPFTENKEWIRLFGQKPEKGRYRYAGQWKHGRMHGCGVYEVNERPIYGRFYFGELLEDSTGCDANVSALHAGIAEVAAAKARMFVNKPDGMVREERGPYSDPQHPYLYEGEDVWMAPGFINQFYEVPNYWKKYVHEVDQEREMWLNSFYKAPFRIPMPAELEYWWSKDESPEFVLINKEPEPDPTDPSKLIYTEDPLILHTRTGRLINYVEDKKYGIRLFWQPPLKDGEEVDPEKAQFLPLGFDEFYGRATRGPKKEGIWKRFIVSVENACKPVFDKLENWTEEKKKASEMKLKLIEQELEFIEAELCLEETIEDMETELKKKQKEEEKKVEMGQLDAEDMSVSAPTDQDRTVSAEDEEEEEEEEEEEDEATPTSFGSVLLSEDQDLTKNDKKGSRPGKSPFATSSMLFASCGLALTVPSKLQQSFLSWKKGKSQTSKALRLDSCTESSTTNLEPFSVISFPCTLQYTTGLKLARQKSRRLHRRHDGLSQLHSLSRILSGPRASSMLKGLGDELSWGQWLHVPPDGDMDTILSMHFPLCTGSCTEVLTHEDLVVTGGTSC